MEKINPMTPNIAQENVRLIAEMFPITASEVTDEDGSTRIAIDFDVLRELLGDVIEGPRERYQFTWPGKRADKEEARQPISLTLRPKPEASTDWESTQNLYIEGDNFDALKILRSTYAGRVKLIYIDPPYNTGSDNFLYPDSFRETSSEYETHDGTVDDEGYRLTENKESFGRFHSVWCSMMHQRLLLLRDLLASDGLIAVSINDKEVFNLGKIMDEVFGASNRLACAPWRSEPSGGKDKTALRTGHEYILFYCKSPNPNLGKEEVQDGDLNLSDKDGSYRKGRELRKWGATSDRSDRPNLWFGITAPNGTVVYPYKNDGTEGYWRWGKDHAGMMKLLEDPEAAHWELCSYDDGVTVNGEAERWVPYEKIRENTHFFGWNTWLDGYGINADATAELKALFDGKKPFDTPKPTKLLKWIIGLYDGDEAPIILDIFSGAAATADAVMQKNADDGGNRQFIMVQVQEECPSGSVAANMGYSTICEIGEERIRRAGTKIVAEVEEANRQLKLGEEPKPVPDVGFRVLRIDSSNFTDTYATPDGYDQDQLHLFEDNVKPDRSDLDLLFQVLPTLRIPYSATIEEIEVCGKRAFNVNHGQLVACFDVEVGADCIEQIAKMRPIYAVFRDASMADDATEANFEELFKTFSPDTVRKVI